MNYIVTLIQDDFKFSHIKKSLICINVNSKENLELTLRMIQEKYTIEEATEENISKLTSKLLKYEMIDLGDIIKPLKDASYEEDETFILNMPHKVSYDPDHDIRIPAPSKYLPGSNPKPYSHKRK